VSPSWTSAGGLRRAEASVGDVIKDLISKGNKKILLNLAEVNFIDSSARHRIVDRIMLTFSEKSGALL
jgi:hypothetical protein